MEYRFNNQKMEEFGHTVLIYLESLGDAQQKQAAARIWILIKSRQSRDNAITAREIGIGGSTVRAHVHQFRLSGIPICSGSAGYWLSANPAEVRATIRNLNSRIKSIKAAREGLMQSMEPNLLKSARVISKSKRPEDNKNAQISLF